MTPVAELVAYADGRLVCGAAVYRCALGRGGVTAAKREGDGATPSGVFPLRRLYYRADRGAAPATRLPLRALRPTDGWCDCPSDPRYNRHVTRPYAGRHEALWRDDHLYDFVVVIGYNDRPVLPERGSAVFMHLARDDYAPTDGCIALRRTDLLAVLATVAPNALLTIVG